MIARFTIEFWKWNIFDFEIRTDEDVTSEDEEEGES